MIEYGERLYWEGSCLEDKYLSFNLLRSSPTLVWRGRCPCSWCTRGSLGSSQHRQCDSRGPTHPSWTMSTMTISNVITIIDPLALYVGSSPLVDFECTAVLPPSLVDGLNWIQVATISINLHLPSLYQPVIGEVEHTWRGWTIVVKTLKTLPSNYDY